MNENENNFESLRQLLALKKHEVPPPGYFNRFSHRVISEIESGERLTDSERFFATVPWLFRLLSSMQARPALVGTAATGIFVLMAIGLIVADRPDSSLEVAASAMAPVDPANSLSVSQTFASSDLMTASASSSSAETAGTGLAISTNLSLQPVASMFGHPNSLVQPASFNGN